MRHDEPTLPVVDRPASDTEETAPCSPTNYVTNEQAAIARQMRVLRTRAEELRARMDAEDDAAEKARLTAELAELRQQRSRLTELREQAIHRKMIMLGHEPPDALI